MASRKNKISKEQQRWNRLEAGDLVFRSKSAANLTELDLLEVIAVNSSARNFLAKDYSNKMQLVQERKFITEEELAKKGIVIKNMDDLRGKGEKQKEESKGFYLGTCNMSSCKSGLPATFYNSGNYAHYCIICASKINEANLPYVGYDLCKEVSEEEVTERYYDEKAQTFLADRYIIGTCPKCGFEHAHGDQCENCGSTLNATDLINPKSILSGDTPVKKEVYDVK